MKKIVFGIIIIFLAWTGMVNAEYVAPIKFMDNATVVATGTGVSVFIIDLTKTDYEDAELMSIQLSGVTERYARPGAGCSIWFTVASTNTLPLGLATEETLLDRVQGVYNWKPVMPPTDVYTGNSLFQYTFRPEPGRYLMITANNTGTTQYRTSAFLGMHKGTGWLNPIPMPISSTYSVFGIDSKGVTIYEKYRTGTSISGSAGYDAALVPPLGAGWVILIPKNDDIIGTFNWFADGARTVPGLTKGEVFAVNTKNRMPVEKYLRMAWITGGVTNGCVAMDWYVDEPRD